MPRSRTCAHFCLSPPQCSESFVQKAGNKLRKPSARSRIRRSEGPTDGMRSLIMKTSSPLCQISALGSLLLITKFVAFLFFWHRKSSSYPCSGSRFELMLRITVVSRKLALESPGGRLILTFVVNSRPGLPVYFLGLRRRSPQGPNLKSLRPTPQVLPLWWFGS